MTMRRASPSPSPSTITAGRMQATPSRSRAAAQFRMSSADPKRMSVSSVARVGGGSASSPPCSDASASAGRIQRLSINSPPSWRARWPSGSRAAKNRVEYRRS